MNIEKRIAELGIEIPEVMASVAAFVPAVITGDLIFISGHIPVLKGELKYRGKLGGNLTIEDGYEAAKLAAINCLAAAKKELGDLGRIKRVVKVCGYVASAAGFTDQPKVINGASELLINIFGENGKHARKAIGVAELPLGVSVEVEMICEISK